MRSFLFKVILNLLLLSMISMPAYARVEGAKKGGKTGILLVAFGSSIPRAQAAFQNIEKKVVQAFPDVPVRWAYTSRVIRQKLAKQGKALDSVELGLARMIDEGFTQVAVQSLHTIPGEEYHDLVKTVQAFRHMGEGFDRISMGYPLLGGEEDLVRVSQVMVRHIPKERRPEEGVVLMGHGTPHPSHALYAALTIHLQKRDPKIFLGTVDGSPGIQEIKEMLVSKGIRKVFLMPFMSVAGDHALNDLAGEDEDSWKSILTKAGISCTAVLKGTAEYDDMVDIWVDHLRKVMGQLK